MQPSIRVGPTIFRNRKLRYLSALVRLAKWTVAVDLSPSSSWPLIFATSTPFHDLRLWFYPHKYGLWNYFRPWICPRLHLNHRNLLVFNTFHDLGRNLWSWMFTHVKWLEAMDLPPVNQNPWLWILPNVTTHLPLSSLKGGHMKFEGLGPLPNFLQALKSIAKIEC